MAVQQLAAAAVVVAVATVLWLPGTVAAQPSEFEQYMLELINRARADPAAEAARSPSLAGNVNEGPTETTLTVAPKQPLAFDTNLLAAARGHTADQLAHGLFGHTGSGGTQPHDRIVGAGYPCTLPYGSGENVALQSSSGLGAASIGLMHRFLFVDAGVAGRGHRTNLLHPQFSAVGIGARHASGYSRPPKLSDAAVDMVTQDFAFTGSRGPFITGVAYDDTRVSADHFYTPGEGLPNVSITAVRKAGGPAFGPIVTQPAGGYALQVTAGTYDVTMAGSLGTLTYADVVVGAENVKLDYNNYTVAADVTPPTPSPMTFAVPPAAAGDGSIAMRAASASDPAGVEYYFEATPGGQGGHDSGWQSSSTYVDAVPAGATGSYRVRARDRSPRRNVGAWSEPVAATAGGCGGGCSVASGGAGVAPLVVLAPLLALLARLRRRG